MSVVLFIFGIVVGSFLNVVGLRFNSGISFGGRSHCSSCRKTLSWYELVPVLSFLYLGGRCRRCRAKISWQYPIVEVLTGLLFATVFSMEFTVWQNTLLLSVFSTYIVIGIYDLRHKIIPDMLVYAAIALSLALRFLVSNTTLDWWAGPLLFAFFGAIWLFSQGRAMGFGDAKLVLSMGLLLGAAESFSAVTLAVWIGAAYGLSRIFLSKSFPLLRVGRELTMKSEIPFAPFLILGAWLSFIFQLDLLHVTLF